MQQFSRLIRNFLKLGFSGVGVAVCFIVAGAGALTNYLACQFAFELLGWDKKPLIADDILGPFLGACFPKATINHSFALVVTLVLNLTMFFCFQIMSKIIRLFRDRSFYTQSGDIESARMTVRLILEELLLLTLFILPLIWAVQWDLELFRWRTIAGSLGIESSDTASELVNFEHQMVENGLLWAWSLTRIGGWGYLAVTVLSCLGLEYTVAKTGEHFAGLCDAIGNVYAGQADQEGGVIYGYDQNGQPVFDPYSPITYDPDGNPLDAHRIPIPTPENAAANGYHQQEHQTSHASPGLQDDGSRVGDESGARDSVRANTVSQQEPLWEPSLGHKGQDGDDHSIGFRESHDQRQGMEQPRTANRDLRTEEFLYDVIGGAPGERVSLAIARVHPERYWVDDESKITVWDVNHRRALFGDEIKHAA